MILPRISCRMASTCFNLLHRVFPFSDLLTGSENDLIKAVQPDAVISDWSWADNIDHDFGDSPNEPIPTSVFAVVKRCFLVAQKTAEEIGSSFLMGSPRYFKVKPVEEEKQVDVMYKVPTFAENVYGYVENGGKVDHKDLARLYRFQSIVEDLRLMNYREGNRTNACKTVGSNVLKFSDLSVEVKSQYLIAQGIRAQTKKFKKIVVITGQDDWYGIRRFWNAPRFQEIEDIKRQLYVSREDSGLEFPSSERNSGVERRPVRLAAGGAASLVVSVLLGEKMRSVCNFIRKEKTGIAPWLACAGFAIWLQYGDAVTSLPAAPAIARLGRGIQSLYQHHHQKDVTTTLLRQATTIFDAAPPPSADQQVTTGAGQPRPTHIRHDRHTPQPTLFHHHRLCSTTTTLKALFPPLRFLSPPSNTRSGVFSEKGEEFFDATDELAATDVRGGGKLAGE